MPTENQNGQEVQTYRKIAIVGSWSPTMDLCPYDDKDLEIWGLAWRGDMKRVSRVFDLHSLKFLKDKELRQRKVPQPYTEHLNNLDCPIYLQEKHPEVPKSIPFPVKEIQGFFMHVDPHHTKPYFASTVAYMIAMAIAEGVNEIHLYGIDLSEDSEWGYQKPNTEYYIGIARGRGIRVILPEESSLLTFSHVYGYEEFPVDGDIFLKACKGRVLHYDQKIKKLEIERATYDGARQEALEAIRAFDKAERIKGAYEGNELPDESQKKALNGEGPKKKNKQPKSKEIKAATAIKSPNVSLGESNG